MRLDAFAKRGGGRPTEFLTEVLGGEGCMITRVLFSLLHDNLCSLTKHAAQHLKFPDRGQIMCHL